MAYSCREYNNEDATLDWDDPCIGGESPAFFYPSYFVPNPSSERKCLSPVPLGPVNSSCCSPFIRSLNDDTNAYALSGYSYSKSSPNDNHGRKMHKGRMPIEEEEDEEMGFYRGVRRYYENSTCICLFFQVILWLLVSVGIFIVLFSIATRPGSPELSVKRIAFHEFGVSQGSDKSGVPTKVFSCSSNITLELDNRSQFFGVHVHPTHITMSFAELTIATGQGAEIYVERDSTMSFNVHSGAKRKAVYGAGPSMLHLLQSRGGLPIVMHINIESSIRVVWDLVKPKFSHHIVCHMLVNKSNGGHHLKLAQTSCSYHAS
ncbi:hypothetical protein SUGI_0412440 [Cryptomeria japonica]|nr:hypothetical protein SUGI_0412440 [Cryptomeria japonica]